MTEHPMQPPPELLIRHRGFATTWEDDMRAAYAAGADAELEACREVLGAWMRMNPPKIGSLLAARRPKPPSLKQQALDELTAWAEMRNGPGESLLCDGLSVAIIRRALEALPND